MAPQSRLTVRNLKDVTLVTLSDTSVVAPQVIDSIKRELFELVDEKGCGNLILDLSKVQYLSSSALGVLIPLHEKTQNLRGRLILCGVSPDIMKVFKITKLDKLFAFKDTENNALADFGVTQPA